MKSENQIEDRGPVTMHMFLMTSKILTDLLKFSRIHWLPEEPNSSTEEKDSSLPTLIKPPFNSQPRKCL